MLLLPSHSPWAAPALAGPPPRGTNAAASPSSNPRTQRRDASAPAPQHSNPHPHPVPMPHGAGPRFQQPAPPRRRITPHGHPPCPTHPIPKPQERVMWDGGLILDPARRQRLRQVFPGRPGRREGILEGRGAEQRVGKWSCRWRWPGLWSRLCQDSDGRRMGKGMLLSWAGWLRTRPLHPTHSAAMHIIIM